MKIATGYSRTQITLHWTIAALIIAQFVGHEGIVASMTAFERGTEVGATDLILTRMHVIFGAVILLLAIWRLVLRLTRGAPAAPDGEAGILKIIAAGTHVVLYAVIFLMPISGLLTWFVSAETYGIGHEIGKVVMLLIVLLHTVGALYHWLFLKSGVMQRMFRAG
ncbi:MAG: cytochrome b/b6 domain-containing protein [Rhodobacteraceae bacterium]|nr:cytochrome b/b6 domain-containing protein [Paracoccaceae bacterium]